MLKPVTHIRNYIFNCIRNLKKKIKNDLNDTIKPM